MNLKTSVIITIIIIGFFLSIFVIPLIDKFEAINCIGKCEIPKITVAENIQQKLGWEASVGFNDTAWILSSIALIITTSIFIVTQHETKKLESAKLILDIESRFLQPENKEVSKRMDMYLDSQIPFDIGTNVADKNRRDLYNYLSQLEVVCEYHDDGVMTTTQVYELLGSGIIDVMRIESIVDLIDKERKKPHQADLYDNLQKTFGIMIDHQNKKFKKKTLENIKEFISKKLNNTVQTELKKLITFDVQGKPPKKSNWGTDDAHLIIKLREEALKAREKAGIHDCFTGNVKLNLTVFAPNITDMDYKQNGDDDPKKFIGDLDSLVAGVCEYLQPAPTNPELEINSVFDGRDDVGPSIPLIVKNDAQIVEISAKKEVGDTLHYHVEIEFL